MVIRNYVIMLYGFFERIYFLYRRKWIEEDTWKQWQPFSKSLPLTPFSGTFISRLGKCSTNHSKTTSLESSAARDETDFPASGIAFDSFGWFIVSFLHDFNNCDWVRKPRPFCA